MLTGADAVRFMTEKFPDWLPTGVKWRLAQMISPPQPPLLREVPRLDRGVFLLNAYITFFVVHAKPGSWELQRKRACGVRSSAPQFRGMRASIERAADIMAGEAWGELQEVVDAGKSPAFIAPHAWLLWCVQNHFAKRGSPPRMEQIFSPGSLLNEEVLRFFAHTATDLVAGSVRSLPEPASGHSVCLLYKTRYQEASRGVRRADSLSDALGRSLRADDVLRIPELYEAEKREAQRLEGELAASARQGNWVWGRWIAAEGKKVLWHPMAPT